MNHGLKDKHRQAIIDILAANSRVKRVTLFGSRAMGTFTTTSDVDLALYGDELTLTDQAKLAAAIDDLPMAQRVDLLIHKSIDNGNLKEHIKKHGVEWFRQAGGRSANSQLTEYGTIKDDYSRDRLIDLCIEKIGVQTGPFGSQLHNKDYVKVGTPIITVEHLGNNRILHQKTPCVSDQDKERLSKYHLQTGDIVFSRVGSVDRRALVRDSENGWLFSGRCLRVRVDKEKIDPTYLSYFFGLENFRQYIRSIAVGATMPSINTKILSNVPIYYPSLGEQCKIVKVLCSLDDKIELNRQINQTLEQIAQAIFKSWFVDFEPVKAKIAAQENGLDPERAAMCAISGKSDAELNHLPADQLSQLATTAALFPDGLVDSKLGMIPKGWEWKSLNEIVELNPKRVLKKGTIAPYLDMKNMPTQGHLAETWWPREMGSGTKFINGDTLMARITPCLENGKTAFVDFLNEDEVGWGSTEYIIMRAKVPLPIEYTYMLARDNIFRSFAIQNMTGTSGRQRVNVGSLENYQLAVADEENIYEIFSIMVKKLMTQIKCNGDQNKTLAQLRDTLLPKLLSGEISVAETHDKIEDAV
ncbi:MAG: restriction endonuclease subunit S [Pseudomonadota bacterium]|nr:restriction endonuclease subunit S [Pseudomonadota bacterium]